MSTADPQPPAPRNGLGVAALCLALAGLVSGLVPITGVVALVLGALAVPFGLLGAGRVRRGSATNRRTTIAGAVLGLVAVALGGRGTLIVVRAVDELPDQI